MNSGLAYDSNNGRQAATFIMERINKAAWEASKLMADRAGPFARYKQNAEPLGTVLNRQGIALDRPVRNAQTTVLAPTGTISFLMDCKTTGIEPHIALAHSRNFVGGGNLTSQLDIRRALKKLQYSKDSMQTITSYLIEHGNLDGCTELKDCDREVFATALGPGRTISPDGHLSMMAAVQPHLSGAISKTINMPASATPKDIERLFTKGWELGLKAVAVYRDGSKGHQPVNVGEKTATPNIAVKPLVKGRTRPLDTHHSIAHRFNISGHKGYLHVGLNEAKQPIELFLNIAKEGSTVGGWADMFAIAVSYALQAGVDPRSLIKKFKHQRFDPSGSTTSKDIPFTTSIVDYVFRFIENNILAQAPPAKTGAQIGLACSVCGESLIANGRCHVCPGCGATTGCG